MSTTTSQISQTNNDNSQLMKRLEAVEKKLNYSRQLEKQIKKLNKKIYGLENGILTLPQFQIQNYYSSEMCEKERIFFGSTKLKETDWEEYQDSYVKLKIDISSCNFSKIPTIVTNLGGNDYHCSTKGGTSVYEVTESSFYVVVYRSGINPNKVNGWDWHLNWAAIGEINY
ncbi:hypothetical protein M0812_16441 [Anaeramoeba flamelloides]|uniref:Uncharacterized protein n=1 Tax=Anaeramoeba flamelloides TaxID=1746091 RepID=A0AAV7ZAT5_9EUKA|nr:hypothetical protein M0812_16441 [Anaeramoeba flamelloides]